MTVTAIQTLLNLLGRFRFSLLLAAQLLLFVTLPAVELAGGRISPVVVRLLIGIAFAALVLAAVYAVSENRRIRITAMILAVPTVCLEAFDILLWGAVVHNTSHTLTVLFLGFTNFVLLRFLFQPQRVSCETISASLCVYMLMGTLWAYLYALLEALVPHSFGYAAAQAAFDSPFDIGGSQSISAFYYSFVTMTTLGYGDIVPVSSAAKMLSALQAVLGQLYLTVLVARMVGLHIAQSAGRLTTLKRKR